MAHTLLFSGLKGEIARVLSKRLRRTGRILGHLQNPNYPQMNADFNIVQILGTGR
jgi:hypothetical protein